MPYVFEATFDGLYDTCKEAGKQFRFYEKSHMEAGKTEKAQTNREFAEKCEAACKAWDDENS